MAKISINTLDKQKTYEYQKSFIKADKYEVEIKANQLHSPNAAKLIILNGKIIYSFLLIQPIIKVEGNGDIVVMTTSKWKDVTYINGVVNLSKKEVKNLSRISKLYKAKSSLGLTLDEVFEQNKVNAELNLSKIFKHKFHIEKGGGF